MRPAETSAVPAAGTSAATSSEAPSGDTGPGKVVVVGAGPAGLTAALELVRAEVPVTVYEATHQIGGISRTEERDGWRFDIGGHRFFTKVPEVEKFWHEVLSDDEFLQRPRMSRILYRGQLFDYPLKAFNALRGLGIVEAIRCVASYGYAQVRPPKDQSHFEGWVTARFGRRLYSIFFKTYTEKVWGIPATSIQADWAAQRIKNLSLFNAITAALLPKKGRTDITTLIDKFQYPKYGPGMMWERARDLVDEGTGTVVMQAPVLKVHRDEVAKRGTALTVKHYTTADSHAESSGGATERTEQVPFDQMVSSMPFTELVLNMEPPAPVEVQEAARGLHYRDFLTVALVVPEEAGFPDNWIYIHTPGVKVGRVQNYGSWSPYLVKEGRTCLGLEYFVNEGDGTWTMSDEDLIAMGTKELEELKLVKPGAVEVGYVVRVPKAYPVYDEGYDKRVDVIRHWLAEAVPNIQPVGRNGMHKYNNQDHSMVTAMYAAENILAGKQVRDLWAVNVEKEYHEEKDAPTTDGHEKGTGRMSPIYPARSSDSGSEGGKQPVGAG